MFYLGIDSSLNATGLSLKESGEYSLSTLKPPKDMRGVERIAYLERIFENLLDCHGDQIKAAALEGYSFGSKNGKFAERAEWAGAIRLNLYRAKIPTLVVPPKTLKKYLHSGNIEKNKVILEVFKQYKVEAEDDNQADALVLSDMAEMWITKNNKIVQRKQEALAKSEILYNIKKKAKVRKRR